MGTQPRLVVTVLLVLIAFGGAGLAVAADRGQDADGRPEMNWDADHAAAPWIAKLNGDLSAIDTAATVLARAGRDTLGNLQSLNLDAMRAAVDAGDGANARITAALGDLASDQADTQASVERWRLGSEVAAQFDTIDAAASAVGDIAPAWARVKARATAVAALVDDLQGHDSAVFRATTAGRQSKWSDAQSALADAAAALTAAQGERDSLAGAATVDTLDQLLARYATYDQALTALYAYMAGGGAQSGDTFDALSKQVDVAQAALPGDAGVMSVIVGETAGTDIADALVDLEQARGAINDALDALDATGENAPRAASPTGL